MLPDVTKMNNLSFGRCQNTLEILLKCLGCGQGQVSNDGDPTTRRKAAGDQQEEDWLQDAWEVSKGHFLIWKTEQYY